MEKVVIDLSVIHRGQAKLNELPAYVQKASDLAGDGKVVVLTGSAPIWMYLKIAHALHGKVTQMFYSSPVTGEIEIFNHNPH